MMDQELTEEDGTINASIKSEFSPIANVSCQYDASQGKELDTTQHLRTLKLGFLHIL